MVGYLSETAFVGKLSFDIIMWIVILLITFYCIRRYPTDYDTNYRKRNRIILGSLCFLAALGFLFWGFMLPEDFAIRNYFLSTFGTYTPNETMIQLGMSPTVSPRAVGVTPVFALPTYEQWLILQKINSFAVTFALGIIFFFFKKSSTRALAKVRKVCGYIFLIFLVPAALNIHLYFDLEEFIVTIPICIITWLLLRTYLKDFVEPTLPVESVQHGDNKDFAPIIPELKTEIQQDEKLFSNKIRSVLLKNIIKYSTISMKDFKYSHKTHIRLLTTSLFLSIILSSAFLSIYQYYRERCEGYEYNSTYDLWISRKSYWKMQEYAHVDYKLGEPIFEDCSLYFNRYWYDNGIYKGQPQYCRLLSYKIIEDSAQYISTQMKRLEDDGYEYYGTITMDKHNSSHLQLVFYDGINHHFKYMHDGVLREAHQWCRKHVLEVRRGKAYEFIAYVPDFKIYDNDVENTYLLDDPAHLWNLKTWLHLAWSFIILSCVLIIYLFVLFIKTTKQTQNTRAKNLLMYLFASLFIEYLIYVLLLLTPTSFRDYYGLEVSLIFITYLLIFRLPLMIYTFNISKTEENVYYLFPQWLINFLNRYTSSEASIRAMLVFIIFPLFYLCTLPCGIFVLVYLIPAVIIYLLVFFIVWIIKGTTQEINKN